MHNVKKDNMVWFTATTKKNYWIIWWKKNPSWCLLVDRRQLKHYIMYYSMNLPVGIISPLLSQPRLHGCNNEWSEDIGSQVPCGIGSRTGSGVWDLAWCNKYLTPIFFCAHLRKLTHLNPPLPLDSHNALRACNTTPNHYS